ncbi:MAG: zinc-ribbon domain-containing protein [Nanoarchaeota archaeon]|nr:zinc-ribbon domain-containing protein [Nanoarchaeota archaeon]
MKISVLVTGIISVLFGLSNNTRWLLGLGIILMILSFFWKNEEQKKEEQQTQEKTTSPKRGTCTNCGAELHSDDNFCPECGKKILP